MLNVTDNKRPKKYKHLNTCLESWTKKKRCEKVKVTSDEIFYVNKQELFATY